MPRFHFNIYDGADMPDAEGVELAGWREARLEAIRVAGEVLSNEYKSIALGEDWHMDVTDERGLLLFRLDFHVSASPAIRSDRLAKERPN